jgi:hypothetical protein
MKQREEIITNSKQVVETQIMEFILDIVQSYFNVGEDYYRRRTRKYDIVLPRQIAMYLIRKHTSLSLSDIGVKFGNKDHATVLHGVRKVKGYMDVDRDIKNKVNDIDKIVKFKNKAVAENINLNKDYYYIDLSNFVSMKMLGDKSIILSGFSDDEVSDFAQSMKAVIELKEHENTGMYILEKRDLNGEEK